MPAERRSVFTLPKAHLHAHLILSARRETMAELADRYGVDLGDAWACGSLDELIQKSPLAFGLIRNPDDLARLCREFVEDEATQGVAYTQPMLGVGLLSRHSGSARRRCSRSTRRRWAPPRWPPAWRLG